MEKKELMEQYDQLIHGVFMEVGYKESPCAVLLDLSHPLAATDLASRARKVWVAAAEAWDNPNMAAYIRSVESRIAVSGVK